MCICLYVCMRVFIYVFTYGCIKIYFIILIDWIYKVSIESFTFHYNVEISKKGYCFSQSTWEPIENVADSSVFNEYMVCSKNVILYLGCYPTPTPTLLSKTPTFYFHLSPEEEFFMCIYH